MKTPLLYCFLFAYCSVTGQNVHEIKTDILLPFFKGAHLSYEYIPNGKLGIEFDARYRWSVDGAYTIRPQAPASPEPVTEFIEVQQRVLTFTLSGKYYLQEKKNGNGSFVGGYIRNDLLVTSEIDLYDELTIPEYDYYGLKTRQLRTGLGVIVGYKLLINQHFLVEVGMGLDFRLGSKGNGSFHGLDIAGIPTLKAGYRF